VEVRSWLQPLPIRLQRREGEGAIERPLLRAHLRHHLRHQYHHFSIALTLRFRTTFAIISAATASDIAPPLDPLDKCVECCPSLLQTQSDHNATTSGLVTARVSRSDQKLLNQSAEIDTAGDDQCRSSYITRGPPRSVHSSTITQHHVAGSTATSVRSPTVPLLQPSRIACTSTAVGSWTGSVDSALLAVLVGGNIHGGQDSSHHASRI